VFFLITGSSKIGYLFYCVDNQHEDLSGASGVVFLKVGINFKN